MKGAVYIGQNGSLEDIIRDNNEENIMLLHFDSRSRSTKDQNWNENNRLFFNEVTSSKNIYKFYVVDDSFQSVKSETPCVIKVIQGGVVLVKDLVAQQRALQDKCVIRWQCEPVRTVKYPDKLIKFKVTCPGGSCNRQVVYEWICSTCSQTIKLTMEGCLYCSCGKSSLTDSSYNCSSKNHGIHYKKHGDTYLEEVKTNLIAEGNEQGSVSCMV